MLLHSIKEANKKECHLFEIVGFNNKKRKIINLLKQFLNKDFSFPFYFKSNSTKLDEILQNENSWDPSNLDGDSIQLYKKMVEESIHEINKQLSKENNILHDTDFEIFGDNSNFDSITLINFISLMEKKIKLKHNKNLNLLNTLMEERLGDKSYKVSDFYKDIERRVNNK